MSNRAWVTLATNDSYGLGALVLANSLRRVNSAFPAVVLITPSVTEPMRDRLRAAFAEVVLVDVLDSRDAAHLALLQRPELGITFTKIHCWNLTQYEKCVFLDADILVVQNCDELFEREQLSAAPDVGWPDCFNSGVFVFTPSADTFSQLITFAQERGSFDGGDQGLLNSFFSDWAHGDINKHLPFLYNVTSAAFYSYLPALKHYGQNLKIIHFIGPAKPWLQQYNFESSTVDAPEHIRGFLQLWWDIFVSLVHPQLDTAMVEVEETSEVPAIPPQDVSQQYHYQPIMDPQSEFAWHHPNSQKKAEAQEKQLDISEFHNPWDLYRGHIASNTEIGTSSSTELVRLEDREEMRKYVWEHGTQEDSNRNNQSYHIDHHWQNNPQEHVHHRVSNPEQHEHIWQRTFQQHEHYCQPAPQQLESHWHSDPTDPQHYEHHWQPNPQQHESHCEPNPQPHEYHREHNPHQHEHQCQLDPQQQEPHWQPHTQQHENHFESNHQQHEHHWQEDHNHNSNHDRVDDYHSHTQQYENHLQSNLQQHEHHWHEDHNHTSNHDHVHVYHSHTQNQYNYKHDKSSPSGHHDQQNQYLIVEKVEVHNNCLQRLNCINSSKSEEMNGDISESESDYHEEVPPRHPYDGFYLRHRITIDARGRKICSHEIPPSPPPDLKAPTKNISSITEDEQISTYHVEVQSGVAGNLARVLPGAPGQREALDELTRRQGWEAGNIDYMGADSFDNIWAKISQTLNRPRSSPPKQSPPKEIAPPQSATQQIEVQTGEVAKEPVSEHVEVAKEAASEEASSTKPSQVLEVAEAPEQVPVAPITTATPLEATAPVDAAAPVAAAESVDENNSVEPPSVKGDTPLEPVVPAETGTPVEAAAPVENAAPVESAVPVEAEAPVKASVPAAPVEPIAPVEIAAQVETAASADAAASPEAVAPVEPAAPVKADAPKELAAPVEAVAPVETAAPVEAVVSVDTAAPVEVATPVKSAAPLEPAVEAPVEVAAPVEPTVTVETSAPIEATAPLPEIPVSVESVASEIATSPKAVVPEAESVGDRAKVETPVAADKADSSEQKTEIPVASETVKEAETVPVSEPVIEKPKVVQPVEAAPATDAAALQATPEKQTIDAAEVSTDSPPLANTPSKEEGSIVPAAKSEERRKPAGKLKLVPPAVADPLPTPDSELEDAATLAQSIIASELRTPTVTSPEPAAPLSPPPAPAPQLKQALSVEEPEVPTPPVGAVSLAQIGVKSSSKGKSSIAAQIESSVVDTPPSGVTDSASASAEMIPVTVEAISLPAEATSPSVAAEATAAPVSAEAKSPKVPKESPAAPPADVPKKKVVKKVVKKEAGATGPDVPVPPPRKKEKKPKEK